jgi:hypothetical protein
MVRPTTIITPNFVDDSSMHQIPGTELDTWMLHRWDTEVVQLLDKWTNMDEALTIWEDKEALHQQFPAAPTWGQVGFQA